MARLNTNTAARETRTPAAASPGATHTLAGRSARPRRGITPQRAEVDSSALSKPHQPTPVEPAPPGRPFTDFAAVTPETPLDALNLDWRERDLPERARTKHVHRLHPYLGKFIPQLAEIFLRKFRPRVVCDPFAGSGTTLIEANALGIASIGVDVSPFNCLIASAKTDRYHLPALEREIRDLLARVEAACHRGLPASGPPLAGTANDYLRAWYHPAALAALLEFLGLIPGYECRGLLEVILCRAARSARLTRHDELDFPRAPQREPYYCHKHKRICPPTTDALKFLRRYALDAVRRVNEFAALRTDAPVTILCADSAEVALPPFDLVLTSPPYVGLIDYHQQHRYAYELLSLTPEPFASVGWKERDLRANEDKEIGAARKGGGGDARRAYIEGMERVLRNVKRSLRPGGRICIVVGDRRRLYDGLAERLGFTPELALTRRVNRRTGRRAGEFYESLLVWTAGR